MSAAVAGATTVRVLRQLHRDPRTLALVVVVPCLLIVLMRYVLDGQPAAFQRVGLPMVGLFPLISMFLVTSITMLRERTTGTLERLMAMPMARLDLLLGYAGAFALLSTVQAAAVTGIGVGLLGLDVPSSTVAVVALAVANALLGMALGLFVSAFASTEFQAVQFMPAFVLPQLLLCGLLVPRAAMSAGLRVISDVLPMTYAYDGLARLGSAAEVEGEVWRDVGIVVGACALALALGAATLRRRTP